MNEPVAPDGRYFVVRGRLWRKTRPDLTEEQRKRLVGDLMKARRALGKAQRDGDIVGAKSARRQIEDAKVALGERGPVWWKDGAPDLNRRLARNTGYAEWFAALED